MSGQALDPTFGGGKLTGFNRPATCSMIHIKS